MINALLKFLQIFLEIFTDLQDDKITEIELGHPLVISGIEKEIDIAWVRQLFKWIMSY